MAIRRVPDISDRENFRIEPVPGSVLTTIRRDPVEPVPVGSYVAMVFKVTGYDQDCDGSLMARLVSVDADGEEGGWETDCHGLYPGSDWVLDGPGDLEALAEGGS